MKLRWTALIVVATSAACSADTPAMRQVQSRIPEVTTAPAVTLRSPRLGQSRPTTFGVPRRGSSTSLLRCLPTTSECLGITRRGIGASSQGHLPTTDHASAVAGIHREASCEDPAPLSACAAQQGREADAGLRTGQWRNDRVKPSSRLCWHSAAGKKTVLHWSMLDGVAAYRMWH